MNDVRQSKNSFFTIFLIALVVGFLAGGLGAWSVQNFLLPQSDRLQAETTQNQAATDSESFSNLRAEEISTIDVVEHVSPSVVSIIVSKELTPRSSRMTPFDDFLFNFPGFDFFAVPPGQSDDDSDSIEQEVGAGTGFIVSEDGLIITNRHVVDDDEAVYSVFTYDGEKHEAEVLARDPILDLAVLRIDPEETTYAPLVLGDSEKLKIGQTVIAIGNTLGEFRNTVTKGVVSGIGRTITAGGLGGASVIEEAIQTDAAISSGNSGGPLLNLDGEVIGINTAVSNRGENVGFAIPSNEAKRIVESVQQYGRIVRPYLGVRYMMLNEQIAAMNDLDIEEGALLIRGDNRAELAVVPGSPADKAGLEENDIITKVNEHEIGENHSLARILARYNPGETIALTVIHDGEEKQVEVTLEEFEEE